MLKFIAKKVYIEGFKRGVREGYRRGKITGSKGFVKSTPEVFAYLDFYNKVIDFAVKTNLASFKKYNPPSPLAGKDILARGCLYIIGERAVILDRSILSMCEDGWVSVAPVIIRSLLECFTNSVAIVKKDSEYMAFKFYAHDLLNSYLDEDFNEYEKDFNMGQVNFQLNRLNPQYKKRAEEYKSEFIKKGKLRNFWYKPEYEKIEDIFRVCDNQGLEWYRIYKKFSMATHSSFIGLGLFKEKPDKRDVNPRADLETAKMALVSSSRLLLEITNIRGQFEDLNLHSEVKQLIAELLKLKKPSVGQLQKG
ncbi:MAG: DUF5677 domain-containing protein [Candidatus Omnitrophica bacterium]|nr:DUF5677 domain-containing protein [Candidatus Omnitrophota bacterium]